MVSGRMYFSPLIFTLNEKIVLAMSTGGFGSKNANITKISVFENIFPAAVKKVYYVFCKSLWGTLKIHNSSYGLN